MDKAKKTQMKTKEEDSEAMAYLNLGNAYQNLGENMQAIECYEKAQRKGHKLASDRLSSVQYDNHGENETKSRKSRIRDCDWLY